MHSAWSALIILQNHSVMWTSGQISTHIIILLTAVTSLPRDLVPLVISLGLIEKTLLNMNTRQCQLASNLAT